MSPREPRSLYCQISEPGESAGFTLIELMVVLAILGILVSLVVPRYLGARKQAYQAEAVAVLSEIKALEWSHFLRHDDSRRISTHWASSLRLARVGCTRSPDATGERVVIRATGNARPLQRSDTVTLTLTAEGEARVESSF